MIFKGLFVRTESSNNCPDCTVQCKSIFYEIDKIQRVTHLYKKGEVIFHQGTPISGVYCLSEGLVKLFTADNDGGEIILRIAGPGDLIGHGCIVTNQAHFHSAVAVDDVKCCFLEAHYFQELLSQHPSLLFKVMTKVQEELRDAHRRNSQLARKNVRERLAYYFSFMAEQHGELSCEGIKINIRLSREDLASYIGTAQETAIRFISEFKSQGLIKESQKFFYVLKAHEMARIANGHISH